MQGNSAFLSSGAEGATGLWRKLGVFWRLLTLFGSLHGGSYKANNRQQRKTVHTNVLVVKPRIL